MASPGPTEGPEPTEGTEAQPAKELDCRGLYCPLPALRSERALARMAPGEVLRVVATDPVAELDLAVLCQRRGHRLIGVERFGEELVFQLRRGAEATEGA